MSERDEKLDGAMVVASVSGGKDSTALSLYLTEQGIEHRRVFADTGWEEPRTYEYLEYLRGVLGPIDTVKSEIGGMVDLIRKRKMFPSKRFRFCTSELKVIPIKEYLDTLESEPVNVVGIRGGESSARAKMPEWEWSDAFDCWTWRPLIDWSVEDVIAIHNRHNVRPNPLYLEINASRVGCFPCIYAKKSEIQTFARVAPEKVALIEQLEAEQTELAASRREAAGLSREDKPRTFFQARTAANGTSKAFPIREAVDWANTARGGRQRELFYDHSGGCMRWGLCETSSEPPPSSEADSTEEDGE